MTWLYQQYMYPFGAINVKPGFEKHSKSNHAGIRDKDSNRMHGHEQAVILSGVLKWGQVTVASLSLAHRHTVSPLGVRPTV